MTQPNPSDFQPSDPRSPGEPIEQPNGSAGTPAPVLPPVKPRRKHRWLRRVVLGLLVLIVLLGLLVALIPTIASTSAVRNYVVAKINQDLNGRVEVKGWSISWTGGVSADEVKVFDTANRQVLEIPHFETQVSLLDAARGHYHLGKTVLDHPGFDIVRYADGTTNLSRLQKTVPTPAAPAPAGPTSAAPSGQPAAPAAPGAPPAAPPTPAPDIRGHIILADGHGTIETDTLDAATGKTSADVVTVRSIDADVNIPDINQPITDTLKVVAETGGKTGTVSLDGSLEVAKNNVILTPDQMNVSQNVNGSGLDLATFQSVAPPTLTTLAGGLDVQLSLQLAAGQPGTIAGTAKITALRAGGPMLKGDTYVADLVALTIPHSTIDTSPGLGGSNNYRLRIGDGTANQPIAVVITNTVSGKPTESRVALSGDLTPGMLQNLADEKAPGNTGQMAATVHIDARPLADELPHLLSLMPGTKLASGIIDDTLSVAFVPARADVNEKLSVHDVVADKGTEQIRLEPIDLVASASTAGNGASPGGLLPELHGIAVHLTTGNGPSGGYATAAITGDSLAAIDADVHLALGALQQQWNQVVDFQNMKLDGTVVITANVTNNKLVATATTLSKAESASVRSHVAVNGLVLVTGGKAPETLFNKYSMEAFVDADYTSTADGMKLVIPRILVGDDPNSPDTLIGLGNADNKPITIITSADKKDSGSGAIAINRLNIGRLMHIANALTPAAPSDVPPTEKARLDHGFLSGTIALSTTADQKVGVDSQLALDALVYLVPGAKGLVNERVTVALSAQLTDQFASATLSKCDVATSVLTASISETEVRLKESGAKDAPATPLLQMVRKAAVNVNVASLAALQEKIDAITPPPAPTAPAGTAIDWHRPLRGSELAAADPKQAFGALAAARGAGAAPAGSVAHEEPAKLAGGSLTMALNISRDGADHMIIAPSVAGKGVSLSKGGVGDPIGDISINGQLAIVPASAAPTTPGTPPASQPSVMDQIALVQLTDLAIDGVGSQVKLNGTVADLKSSRQLNLTLDLSYDAAVLWKAILPTLSAASQKSMKDAVVEGKFVQKIPITGNYPDAPFEKAIASVNTHGEIRLDKFTGQGAEIQALVLPFNLTGGVLRLVYGDRPEAQSFPVATQLNGGKLVLAGTGINLADPHMTISIPPGTKVLDGVNLNALLASNIGDFINNPLFVGADKAAGQINLIVNTCDRLPTDTTLTSAAPSNIGVFDMDSTITRIQLGNAAIKNISDQLAAIKLFGGSTLAVGSLQGDVKSLHVHMAKGVTTEDLVLTLGEGKRPLHLFGDVAMQTKTLNMTLDLPFALFKANIPQQVTAIVGDGVKLPMTGPVSKPQFNIGAAVQANLKGLNLNNPQDILKNVPGVLDQFKKPKDQQGSSTTQPASNDNPVGDIIDLFGKKKKPE